MTIWDDYTYNLSKSLNFLNVENRPASKQSMHLAGKSGFGNIYNKQKDKRDLISLSQEALVVAQFLLG